MNRFIAIRFQIWRADQTLKVANYDSTTRKGTNKKTNKKWQWFVVKVRPVVDDLVIRFE